MVQNLEVIFISKFNLNNLKAIEPLNGFKYPNLGSIP